MCRDRRQKSGSIGLIKKTVVLAESRTKNMDTIVHPAHIEEHMSGTQILRDIVIGMSDGLTVPFALAAGLSGAVGNDHINLIWIAGLAEIAAGSIAMGLGGYLPGKTEMDHYDSEL